MNFSSSYSTPFSSLTQVVIVTRNVMSLPQMCASDMMSVEETIMSVEDTYSWESFILRYQFADLMDFGWSHTCLSHNIWNFKCIIEHAKTVMCSHKQLQSVPFPVAVISVQSCRWCTCWYISYVCVRKRSARSGLCARFDSGCGVDWIMICIKKKEIVLVLKQNDSQTCTWLSN